MVSWCKVYRISTNYCKIRGIFKMCVLICGVNLRSVTIVEPRHNRCTRCNPFLGSYIFMFKIYKIFFVLYKITWLKLKISNVQQSWYTFISILCRNSLCHDSNEFAHSTPPGWINFQIVRILNTKEPIQHSIVWIFKTIFVFCDCW